MPDTTATPNVLTVGDAAFLAELALTLRCVHEYRAEGARLETIAAKLCLVLDQRLRAGKEVGS